MTFWNGRRETRERLARLEKSVQEQVRAFGDQRATLTTLGERLVQFERQLAGIGAQLDARASDVRKSINSIGSNVQESLAKVGHSLKRVTHHEKHTFTALSKQTQRLLGRLARISSAFDPSVDDRFIELAEQLVRTRRTMLGYDRLFTLWQAAGNVAHLNEPAVEVGSFRGGSAALLAQALSMFAGSPRELHVVDTFEGHLDETFSEHDPEQQRGKFREVAYDDVRDYLAAFPGVRVHKGDAAQVLVGWPERRYSLVHVDVDLYRPTLECLEYFGPRLAEGAVIVVDDYEAPTCPGVSLAVHEYLARNPAFQTWRLQAEQVVLVKCRESTPA